MMIYAYCGRCDRAIPIKSDALTRSELEDQYGLYQSHRCGKCGTKKEVHVNQIKAKPSPIGTGILIGVCAVFSLIMIVGLLFIGFISTLTIGLPLAIYVIYQNAEKEKAATFNRIRINRK